MLAVADSATQESLQYENVPDTFASEQTWPTEEELKQAERTSHTFPNTCRQNGNHEREEDQEICP